MSNCTPALSETAWQFLSIVIFIIGFVLTSCYFYTYRNEKWAKHKIEKRQAIGMDFLIIALPLIFGYSLYKQVKRVRSKQWVIHLILIIALSIMCKSETTLQWLTFAGRRRAVVRGNKIKSRGDVVGNINLLLFSSLF